MLEINRKDTEARWYELSKTIKFQIRPFKFSEMMATDIMPMMLEQFNFCLQDWEGVNEDGKKLPVTSANKQFLYDNYVEIRDFVLSKARASSGTISSKELKN